MSHAMRTNRIETTYAILEMEESKYEPRVAWWNSDDKFQIQRSVVARLVNLGVDLDVANDVTRTAMHWWIKDFTTIALPDLPDIPAESLPRIPASPQRGSQDAPDPSAETATNPGDAGTGYENA